MATVVERMNCMRYDRRPSGPVPLPCELVDRPSWEQVQAAIRRMENSCYPIVTLAFDPSEKDGLIIVGGPRRYAMTRIDGSWQYERPDGGNDKVRLWESDQGYYCRERNIIRSRRKVLEIARAFFETGDFAKVAEVASRPEPPKRPRPSRTRFAGPLFDSLDASGRGADPEQS